MRMGDESARRCRSRHPDRLAGSGPGVWASGGAARPGGGDLRPGVQREDHAGLSHHRRGSEERRQCRLHRRRARHGPRLRPPHRGQRRRAAPALSPTTASRRWRSPSCLIRSGALDVLVIDSVAALTPRAEIEGEMGDSHVGLQARLMSQALRKLSGTINKTPDHGHLHQPVAGEGGRHVRQSRRSRRVAGRSSSTRPIRLDIRRIETLKEGTEAVGNRVRVRVVKNKVAPALQAGRVRHHVRHRHLHRG